MTHVDNVAWILDHGLHCRASPLQDPNFVSIGNPDLIQDRRRQRVPIAPGDTLDHYIPFYFTPVLDDALQPPYGMEQHDSSDTRRVGVLRRVTPIPASSRNSVRVYGPSCVHALGEVSTSLNDLEHLAWTHWPQRDFRRDPNDPEKTERYQAETLVHRHLPMEPIDAIVCGDDDTTTRVTEMVSERGRQIEVDCRRRWFF